MGKEAMIGSLCSSASAGLRRRAIKKARRMTIRISDHAMLRWIERVRGFDLTKDRAEIQELLKLVGNDGTLKAHGHLFEVQNGRLITITPATGSPNNTKHRAITGKDRLKPGA
jgi:hypothetical protein